MDNQGIEATSSMGIFVSLSAVVFVAGFLLLTLMRKRTGKFNWTGFVLTMFAAVLLYDIGIWSLTDRVESVLLSIFHSLQVMSANRDFELPDILGLGNAQLWFITVYGVTLFIIAPVSIVTAVLEYFSGFLSSVRLWLKSLRYDSYVFSHLDRQTLNLAQDVYGHYRNDEGSGVCIAFGLCGEVDDEMLMLARRIGSICLKEDAESLAQKCSRRNVCSVILFDSDELEAVTMARRIKDASLRRPVIVRGGETRIFVLTDFRRSESLLFPEIPAEKPTSGEVGKEERRKNRVLVRGIDVTREIVGHIILRYPLFLLSKPLPGVSEPATGDDGDKLVPKSCWYQVDANKVARYRQRELYQRPDRHVLVVGAGSKGIEFLSSALWTSQIDGIRTKFDVIDHAEDPLNPGRPLAESRYAAEAPEIMRLRPGKYSDAGTNKLTGETDGALEELYDLEFSLVDAETDAYVRFIADRADTLSYIFISLGDDLRNARVAMHTRQLLERGLAVSCASREEYLCASRPLIITVIQNDEYAEAVEGAVNEGQPYEIVCVRNSSDVLTYRMLRDLIGNRKTEYNRRSSRASDTHVKYRLFAFARNLYLDRHEIRRTLAAVSDDEPLEVVRRTFAMKQDDEALERVRTLLRKPLDDQGVSDILSEVDWKIDAKGSQKEKRWVRHWLLTLLFQLYCTNGVTHSLVQGAIAETGCREWLLRMEHNRWNAYIRTQGVVSASFETTDHTFATGQDVSQKHRTIFVGLHPCLVSFDELANLDVPIYHLYEAYASEAKRLGKSEKLNAEPIDGKWIQLLDDDYVAIERPKYD